jgi:UDP-GlcNAc:undecaprenyl-phosphate/decaprenyl-phosphate GlcNAc-1-phosphate transferase
LFVSSYLISFFACLIASLALTRWLRDTAVARGWVKAPELVRHVHTHPVPRLGGVAICFSFTIVVSLFLAMSKLAVLPIPVSSHTTFGILGPSLIIFALGLYDDVHSVGPYKKIGIQAVAATLLYFSGFGIHQLGLFSSPEHPLKAVVSLPLTVLWVLLVTNAFNLIDGLDGLAAGAALFGTAVVFIVSLFNPNPTVTFLAIVLAGSILGFLRYNFHPASIFLGDSGSLFIGFVLSALALAGSQKAPTIVAIAIPLVSFGLPISDVALAIVRRLLNRKPLFHADGEHIHHRLLKSGWTQREAVLILYAVSAAFGLLSLVLLSGRQSIGLVLTVVGVGVFWGLQRLRYVEFDELQDMMKRAIQRNRLIANNLNIRHASESLKACTNISTVCHILENALKPLGFDGFHFKNSSVAPIPASAIAPLRQDHSGNFLCSWNRADARDPAWELRMELTTSSGYSWGHFWLFRLSTEDLLVLDINLLNSQFRAELADALQRTMRQAELISSDSDGKLEAADHKVKAASI